MSQRPKVIGIGETGLDYYYNNAPATAQKRSFEMHLEAARAADMPVIIHTRDAEDDTMHMLDNALKQGPLKLLFHCFTSSARLAAYAVERGIYVSASGIITFKKSEDLRKAFALVPMELLLVETDAPYLAPEPHRGAVNEPAHTKWVAQKLAEVKEVPLETLAEATTQNFFKLFPKANKA
jgi:TatD DNase family protein